jgi:pullulanase
VPFFQAGQDLLRSKSEARNSYNAGDWFNRLDWTYATNNWGVGLPPDVTDEPSKSVIQPLLANPALQPSNRDILRAAENFRELLAIRKSSKLFRLETAAEVQARVSFLNTGPEQVPGMIVMRLSDLVGPDLDPRLAQIVVVFNASDEEQTVTAESLAGTRLRLHAVQLRGSDPIVKQSRFNPATGALTVPALTTAVFVTPDHVAVALPYVFQP